MTPSEQMMLHDMSVRDMHRMTAIGALCCAWAMVYLVLCSCNGVLLCQLLQVLIQMWKLVQ